ncbi:MAG: hypothetical protein A2Z97_11455 [Bdellovibrionales bacterium GWB1_52_6]|nr:MAG: hypothetical protein A2Z97_11455 [Bdellovibrionales bacterium GWB1_52_6]
MCLGRGMAALKEYRKKRDFSVSREPRGTSRKPSPRFQFVVQEHHARRLHWDFRLEADGVLKSWAVTREPSMELGVRRLAIETEDHPLEYGDFHGEIPKGEYGAGQVKIWDHGTFEPKRPVTLSMEEGLVEVFLKGKRLRGRFVLVRTRSEGPKSQWIFLKVKPKVINLKIPDADQLAKERKRKKAA